LTWCEEIFLTLWENILRLLRKIFQTQTLSKDGWPDLTLPEQQKLTWPDPGQKILTRTHHEFKALEILSTFEPWLLTILLNKKGITLYLIYSIWTWCKRWDFVFEKSSKKKVYCFLSKWHWINHESLSYEKWADKKYLSDKKIFLSEKSSSFMSFHFLIIVRYLNILDFFSFTIFVSHFFKTKTLISHSNLVHLFYLCIWASFLPKKRVLFL